MDEKKVVDLLHKNELLIQEINGLKEENNSLKMKIRDLEKSSESKKKRISEKDN